MIIIAIVISIFFIVVISLLCRSYTKDIFELENRISQLERRLIDNCKNLQRQIIKLQDDLYIKEGDTMACKKGRGGRKK